jgi:hypothetical protein
MKHGAWRFSSEQFEAFARESVARYQSFLERLGRILDPVQMRICSVFPASVADSNRAAAFLDLHAGTPVLQRHFAEDLKKMEVPDIVARTGLRARYNAHLRAMCNTLGLAYVDDFSPFLDAEGATAPGYVRSHGDIDFHLPHGEAHDTMVGIIWSAIGSAALARVNMRHADKRIGRL